MKLKNLIKPLKYYSKGKHIFNDLHYLDVNDKIKLECLKTLTRTDIIKYLIGLKGNDTVYLEIGVRDPDDNFSHINASQKYSVDPGVEFKANPVDFKMTSDQFFLELSEGEILSKDLKFDVIFIDGLHLAEQVDRDIENAFKNLKSDGFIVLHDCNPLSEWHARENFEYIYTPAYKAWNGTTWKAFLKWRSNSSIYSCCIDTDWGVGILSKKHKIGKPIKPTNPFYEFKILEKNRIEHLNLIDFETFKNCFES